MKKITSCERCKRKIIGVFMENCQARDIEARAGKREGIMTDYKGVKIMAQSQILWDD